MASYQCRGKKKLWSVRFSIIENGAEIQKRLSGYARKKDAEQGYLDYIKKYQEEQKIINPDKNILERNFEDVFEEYCNYKKTKLKDSTFYELNKIKEKHILPYFKNFKIKEIDKLKILNWQNSLTNYSFCYKSRLRVMLYSFYKYLFLYYDVDNVVARVETFKKPNTKSEMQIWTWDEFQKFINTFENDLTYKTFFTYLYYTGCRLGEALAIDYNSLNFNENTINITKSVTGKVYQKESINTTYAVTSPKNQSSFRKILMPQVLKEQLILYLKQYPDAKQSMFFFGFNKPLDDHTIYRRLQKHTTIAENKSIRVHDLRHSHASLLIQQGANVVLVAKRLGHSNTQQTLNTYAHLFPNSEQELVEKINNLTKSWPNA